MVGRISELTCILGAAAVHHGTWRQRDQFGERDCTDVFTFELHFAVSTLLLILFT